MMVSLQQTVSSLETGTFFRRGEKRQQQQKLIYYVLTGHKVLCLLITVPNLPNSVAKLVASSIYDEKKNEY